MEKKVFCFGNKDVKTIKLKIERVGWDTYEATIGDTMHFRIAHRENLYELLTFILRRLFPEYKDSIHCEDDEITFKGYDIEGVAFTFVVNYKNTTEILRDVLNNLEIAVMRVKEIIDEITSDIAEAEIVMCR